MKNWFLGFISFIIPLIFPAYSHSEVQKKLFQFFFITTSWNSGNNTEKAQEKPRSKLKKYLQRLFALPAIQCRW